MKYLDILEKVDSVMNDNNHSFLSYNSLLEEALKLAIWANKSDKPIVVVKENNYLTNKLRDILQSYFNDDELVTYTPEESLRAEEIASSYENRANRLYALYQIINNPKVKIVLCSPYGI